MRPIAVALLLLAAAPAFADPDAAVTAELRKALEKTFGVTYVGVSYKADHVGLYIGTYRDTTVPAWADLRDQTRKAYAIVAAKTSVPALVVTFAAGGALAVAERLPSGELNVRLGDGKILQDDRTLFTLAGTAGVAVTTETSKIGGMEVESAPKGAATCQGKIRNLATTEKTLAARCVIVRHTAEYKGTKVDMAGPLSKSEVFLDELVPVGKARPGAEVAFKQALRPPAGGWPRMPGLTAAVIMQVDGIPTPHLDEDAYAIATDWLAVIEKLRADGLSVDARNPYDSLSKLAGSAVTWTFDLSGKGLEKRDQVELGKAAERAWKLLQAHYTKFKRAFPQHVKLRDGLRKAEIVKGKLEAWKEDMF
ncbi:MAG: hypothetical protein KIT31_02200 [Deltaproteobacteria bacterium]|nr:hypothetical protein [Deltaproteobacteria bacterium]